MLTWLRQFLMKDLIPCFSTSYTEDTINKFEDSMLLYEAFSSIFSGWINNCSLLSSKHFLMLFNFCLVLTFSAEIISWGLALPINLTILVSVLFSLIISTFLTGQVPIKKNGIYSIQDWAATTGQGVTKKKKHKKIKVYRKSVQKESTIKKFLLILDLKPFRS